jgi:hypothetical protein
MSFWTVTRSLPLSSRLPAKVRRKSCPVSDLTPAWARPFSSICARASSLTPCPTWTLPPLFTGTNSGPGSSPRTASQSTSVADAPSARKAEPERSDSALSPALSPSQVWLSHPPPSLPCLIQADPDDSCLAFFVGHPTCRASRWRSTLAGCAPTIWSTTLPFLKINRVGMLWTP